MIWYKNFVKRQAKSPKFLIAVGRCLENIKRKDVVNELIEYNYGTHSISIPYGNSSGSIPIHSLSKAATTTDLLSNTKSDKKGGSGGEGDKGLTKMLRVYEENIGKIRPIILEQLEAFRKKYPVKWFEEAVGEAVKADHLNLKYIEAILKRRDAEVARQR